METTETIIIPLIPTTDEEAFAMVVEHLSTMPHQSVNVHGTCVYRGDSRCAIGALIRDADYRPEIEGNGVYSLACGIRADGVVYRLDFGDLSLELLAELQAVHDMDGNWDPDRGFIGWDKLATVASDYALDAQVVENAREAQRLRLAASANGEG